LSPETIEELKKTIGFLKNSSNKLHDILNEDVVRATLCLDQAINNIELALKKERK
jgi:hypothetical protein